MHPHLVAIFGHAGTGLRQALQQGRSNGLVKAGAGGQAEKQANAVAVDLHAHVHVAVERPFDGQRRVETNHALAFGPLAAPHRPLSIDLVAVEEVRMVAAGPDLQAGGIQGAADRDLLQQGDEPTPNAAALEVEPLRCPLLGLVGGKINRLPRLEALLEQAHVALWCPVR